MSELSRPEGLANVHGEAVYTIADVDLMSPFLVSVVGEGDRWMFVSSTGALTAGRVDASGALFPYETDDRIHQSAGRVGPVTRIRIEGTSTSVNWRPFDGSGSDGVHRSLTKSILGDSVSFTETHAGHALSFEYRWNSTSTHGFVRTASLRNNGSETVRLEVLDGLLGLLPHGLAPDIYHRFSNLTQAYKRSELVRGSERLAVFSIEAPVGDRPEPEEVLRATTVWSLGLEAATVSLDAADVDRFDDGQPMEGGALVTGRAGAYLLHGHIELAPGDSLTWRQVADVGRDQDDVVAQLHQLQQVSSTERDIELNRAIASAAQEMERIVAKADGLQCTADGIASAHQVSNVIYNVMRGGVPLSDYQIDGADFASFVVQRNRRVAATNASWLAELPSQSDRGALLSSAQETGDVGLIRLAQEYLPVSLSRRHGDPSRPWNTFAIHVHDEDGNPRIYFEGNWRDVFQNWEALLNSFPEYLPAAVTMFVNASTADGYNPYRITRDGIDWEVPDPDDPWSNIGYWGDHQVAYLLRLLQAMERFNPGKLTGMLGQRQFTYADVPYRIADYPSLVRDPKATITFDAAAHDASMSRVEELGADGRLLTAADGEPVLVSFLEKLLVPALAKLANFVPGGGIWMNTQRPEWNDANNALVGYGVSVVTLCYLRRYLDFLRSLVGAATVEVTLSADVATWLSQTVSVLQRHVEDVTPASSDRARKQVLDGLGRAASDYRATLYASGLGTEMVAADPALVTKLCELAIAAIDGTLASSKRADGLFHSYNLVEFSDDGSSAAIRHLPEMLEGQVAILSSGFLSPGQGADVVDALYASSLYRDDQHTFLLAPPTVPPSFVDRNIIPTEVIETNGLLSTLAASHNDSLVRRDMSGKWRFHPDLVDATTLDRELDRLAECDEWSGLVNEHRAETQDVYERVFAHRSFRGRSGAMYAYEGIGSTYWHMVTKLLLAVQEAADDAVSAGATEEVVRRLVDSYDRVRSGLGFNKTAQEFGAFPLDPYSHTPAHAGAQQPGMTGAVKEELLTRPRELGMRILNGSIVFDQLLLRRGEAFDEPQTWPMLGLCSEPQEIELPAGSYGFTICQTPVTVTLGDYPGEPRFGSDGSHMEVVLADGRTLRREGLNVGQEHSAEIFGRTGAVTQLNVLIELPPSRNLRAARTSA